MGLIQRRRKGISWIILCIVGIIFGYFIMQQSDSPPETKIPIEIKDTVKLKGMRIQNPLHFTIPITNTSNDSVKINRVETFCGCLESHYPDLLPPFAKDSLFIVFNPQSIGHLTESFLVFIDKSSEPIEVILTGFVKL